MTRQRFVAGNWKMAGNLLANQALIESILDDLPELSGLEVAVCPPFPYLDQVARLAHGSGLVLGAQDVSVHLQGAYTGDVAAGMLADFSCQYVLVGHSERRSGHAESDDLVARKFQVVQQAGMMPVLCLGETLAERQAGQTLEVVCRQLEAVVALQGVEALQASVLAYEPVWAIGTGLAATPEEAQSVHHALRAQVATWNAEIAAVLRIVYGGSVKADNAALLFAQPDIDGGLIGGASLNAKDFLAICRAAIL